MRVAVTIISLGLMLVIGLQSCAVSLGAAMMADDELSGSAAIGILVALIFLVGGAFAMHVPMVSLFSFTIAGLLALLAGTTSTFSDLMFWSVAAFILALMSLFGVREKRLKSEREATPAVMPEGDQ